MNDNVTNQTALSRNDLDLRHERERAALRAQTNKLWEILEQRQLTERTTLAMTGRLPCRTPYHCHKVPRCQNGCEMVQPAADKSIQ